MKDAESEELYRAALRRTDLALDRCRDRLCGFLDRFKAEIEALGPGLQQIVVMELSFFLADSQYTNDLFLLLMAEDREQARMSLRHLKPDSGANIGTDAELLTEMREIVEAVRAGARGSRKH